MTLRQLYERCPDCNGMGSVSVMDGQGRETEYQCERCAFDGGMVPVEPDYEAERCEQHDIRCTKCGWAVPLPEVVLDDFENMILDRTLDRMEGIGETT